MKYIICFYMILSYVMLTVLTDTIPFVFYMDSPSNSIHLFAKIIFFITFSLLISPIFFDKTNATLGLKVLFYGGLLVGCLVLSLITCGVVSYRSSLIPEHRTYWLTFSISTLSFFYILSALFWYFFHDIPKVKMLLKGEFTANEKKIVYQKKIKKIFWISFFVFSVILTFIQTFFIGPTKKPDRNDVESGKITYLKVVEKNLRPIFEYTNKEKMRIYSSDNIKSESIEIPPFSKIDILDFTRKKKRLWFKASIQTPEKNSYRAWFIRDDVELYIRGKVTIPAKRK